MVQTLYLKYTNIVPIIPDIDVYLENIAYRLIEYEQGEVEQALRRISKRCCLLP